MKIAFVGVKRKYSDLSKEYKNFFNRFHLELPYYYASVGNDVTITTIDYSDPTGGFAVGEGWLDCQQEKEFQNHASDYDVVIHWRRWFPELYQEDAINVINCQDHSFSQQWKSDVLEAFNSKKLYGILCFPTWHKENLAKEISIPRERLLDGVTLGVDTEIYCPAKNKDPFKMLWASDPGRGLERALQLSIKLWQKDQRYKLHVCYPDYVTRPFPINHPALVFHGNIPNGPKLWDLFNTSGILPYTSTFYEPSSRAHRQAQAAGSLVLYPPQMGSPSELIKSHHDGIVAPIDTWYETILNITDTEKYHEICKNARSLALSENWNTQALRFTDLFNGIIGE